MNYVIFSVDDSRKQYTDSIRAHLGESFWFNEVPFYSVDGRDNPTEAQWQIVRHADIDWQEGTPRLGQLGIWANVLKAISTHARYEPLLTIEDDAILNTYFHEFFWTITAKLPKDTDAFSLFLPRDQDHVHNRSASELWVAPGICKAYQVYGGVSMLWTPKGAEKFISLVRRDGVQDQWDNQLYAYARAGEMNVYTQTPNSNVLVGISGNDRSIVQESEYL